MTGRFNLVVSDHLHQSGWEQLEANPSINAVGPFDCRDDLIKSLADAHALIIRSSTQVDRELLEAAPKLLVVARAGSQLDNVDIEWASRRGIMVINVPNANVTAVAEHTFAMILALARQLPDAHFSVRSGEWPRYKMLGHQVSGKCIGIIGFGRLGREVASRARAFGMSVLTYDPFIDISFTQEYDVEVVSFEELLSRADIISLHTAYNEQTRHIMNDSAFQMVKPGSWFVNCANGGLVDEGALIKALKAGKLGGAAIDTFETEPPAPDNPLLSLPNTVLAPHLNQNTVESQTATSLFVVRDVVDALTGADYRNIVNLPFNTKTPYATVHPYIHLAEKLGKLQGQLSEGWITRVEIECLGEGMHDLVRPVAAVMLSGMIRPTGSERVNWVSAPMIAYEQGIETAQNINLVQLEDYPNLIACRVYWQGGHRTVAGVLFGNDEARLVGYENYRVDAYPEGYVLILENLDVPGVIGKVGIRLGKAQINIAQWRYGREAQGGSAVSFINLDDQVPNHILAELENEPEIKRARLVHL